MRAKILGSLGALVTLVAAAVVVSPGLTDSLSAVVSVLESRDPKRLLIGLGAAVGLYAVWAARASSPGGPASDGPAARFEADEARPEAVSATARIRTGEDLDERIAAACAGDEKALEAVRSNLVDTAVSAYARSADRTPAEARREIHSGAWTDDPIAAAFLADDRGPGFRILARLRSWLDPVAERRRRIERTVEAVGGIFERRTGSRAGDSEEEKEKGETETGEKETEEEAE